MPDSCPTADDGQETVCNLGEIGSGLSIAGHVSSESITGAIQPAASFTTGSAANGYSLREARIEFSGSDGAPGDLRVAIHQRASGGGPGTELDTLAGDNPNDNETFAFTTSGIPLAADTEYFIVLSAPATSGNNFYSPIAVQTVGQTGSDGWSIGDQSYFKRNEAAFAQDTSPFILSFALIADVTPLPAPSAPSAPTGVTATGGDGEIVVSWVAPTGTTPDGYEVCVLENAPTPTFDDSNCASDGDNVTAVTGGATLTATVADLTNDTEYAIAVRSTHTIADDSAWTTPPTTATPMATPMASSDATLSDLSLSGVTLEPTFDADTTDYTATVGNDVDSTTITATATDTAGATIAYDTPDDTDGTTDDADVELIEGANTITVTVTAADATTNDYTITVTRETPDAPTTTAPETLTPEVTAAAEMAVEESLPVVAAAIAGNVAGAISNRIGAVNAGVGGNNNLNTASLTASFATQTATAMANGAEFESVVGDGVKRLLDGKTHSLALSGDSGVSDGAGVWVGGAYQSLGGEDGTLDWDGDLYSVQIGADARLNNGTIAGAAVSRSEGEWDYENVDVDGKPVEGTIELSTTSVHPYLAWRRASGMNIWASVGYGEGDLENRETTNGAQASGDVELRSASLGIASGDLAVDDASTMRLKFDAQVANTEVDYDDATTDLDVASRRVRVGMEFGGGGNTRRALEFGARYDGGDARSGGGIELGGHWAHDNGDGMSASLNARALLAHGGEHDEWGVSGTLRYAPGADGQGLSWRVEPGWGVTQSGVDRLWTESAAELAASDESDESFTSIARMDSEIAYGFNFGEGMLTPYTGLRLSDGSRDYRLGGRYKLITLPLEMSVEAYRKQRDATENGVLFKTGMSW
ncbi:MAG: cadherin-like beta sandwich domain-containing protein [bacterium]